MVLTMTGVKPNYFFLNPCLLGLVMESVKLVGFLAGRETF